MRYAEINRTPNEIRTEHLFRKLGINTGRISAEQRAATPHAVDAIGLEPHFLGLEVFWSEAGRACAWIDANCNQTCVTKPIRDLDGSVVGICFRFKEKGDASRFEATFFGTSLS